MKKKYFLLILFSSILLSFINCFSQTTIVLQPDETTSKDACVWNIYPSTNYGNGGDFIATAWTNNSNLSIIRALIEFDLSGIPANSAIQSATLSLYYHTSTSNIGHSQLSGSNACWLKRITSPWDEATVTWNNQPATTTQNQVNIPASLNDTMSYPNIDVTNLISDIYNNSSTSYGMELLLQTEQYYRSLLFASSAEANSTLRPKLSVTYIPATPSNDTCIILKAYHNKVHDAGIWNIFPDTNYADNTDFIATTWTWSGNYSVIRGLVDFDLASIPSSAIITSAKLNLYWHSSTSNIGHSQLSGSNESWLRRITDPWDQNTVTWNNQPSTTTVNQVYLPASAYDTQDYPNIDVTALITDIKNNGYGMMFMLNTEQYYRALLFASCSSSDTSKMPWLEICYEINSSVPDYDIYQNNISSVYPNPANNIISIDYGVKNNSDILIEFYSISGLLLDRIDMGYETKGKHNLKYILSPEKYQQGIYFVRIISKESILTNRFIKID